MQGGRRGIGADPKTRDREAGGGSINPREDGRGRREKEEGLDDDYCQ